MANLPAPAAPQITPLPPVPAGLYQPSGYGIAAGLGQAVRGYGMGEAAKTQAEEFVSKEEREQADVLIRQQALAEAREQRLAEQKERRLQSFLQRAATQLDHSFQTYATSINNPKAEDIEVWQAAEEHHNLIKMYRNQALQFGYAATPEEAAQMFVPGIRETEIKSGLEHKKVILESIAQDKRIKETQEQILREQHVSLLTLQTRLAEIAAARKEDPNRPLTHPEAQAVFAGYVEQYGQDVSKWPDKPKAFARGYGFWNPDKPGGEAAKLGAEDRATWARLHGKVRDIPTNYFDLMGFAGNEAAWNALEGSKKTAYINKAVETLYREERFGRPIPTVGAVPGLSVPTASKAVDVTTPQSLVGGISELPQLGPAAAHAVGSKAGPPGGKPVFEVRLGPDGQPYWYRINIP